jgi:acyl CoA:acetate/3-ketoacid CoA transferase
MSKVVSTDRAAKLIRDGDVVSVSSSSGLGCPDAMLAAIGARFAAEGHPRELTTVHPIAAGDIAIGRSSRPSMLVTSGAIRVRTLRRR